MGPLAEIRKGPFLYTVYKIVVNREEINERTKVFVFLKQTKVKQKNESLTNMDVTI